MTYSHQGYNRHQQMRRHKRKMKEKYAKKGYCHYDNVKLLEDHERAEAANGDNWWLNRYPHYARNGGFTYWYDTSLSGKRQFAKKCSERKIRTHYRSMLARMDYDDIPAYKGADYEKEFDYNWTIW